MPNIGLTYNVVVIPLCIALFRAWPFTIIIHPGLGGVVSLCFVWGICMGLGYNPQLEEVEAGDYGNYSRPREQFHKAPGYI